MAGDFQHRENSGSFFPNQRKQSEKHPDYNGSALIGGVEYWVSAWVKQGQRGKWVSLSFTPKDAQDDGLAPQPAQSKSAPSPGLDDFDDSDIPF